MIIPGVKPSHYSFLAGSALLATAITAALAAWVSVALALGFLAGAIVLFALVGLLMLRALHWKTGTEVPSYRDIDRLISIHSFLQPRAPMPALGAWALDGERATRLVDALIDRRPKVVLELGGGVSTVLVGYVLERLGGDFKIISVDQDAEYVGKTREMVERHGLSDHVEVRHGPLTPRKLDRGEWPWYAEEAFAGVSDVDFLIVDGPPGLIKDHIRYPAVPVLFPLLTPGAVVFADDTKRAVDAQNVTWWESEFKDLKFERFQESNGVSIGRLAGPG